MYNSELHKKLIKFTNIRVQNFPDSLPVLDLIKNVSKFNINNMFDSKDIYFTNNFTGRLVEEKKANQICYTLSNNNDKLISVITARNTTDINLSTLEYTTAINSILMTKTFANVLPIINLFYGYQYTTELYYGMLHGTQSIIVDPQKLKSSDNLTLYYEYIGRDSLADALATITVEDFNNLLYQLFTSLYILQQSYNFIHNACTCENMILVKLDIPYDIYYNYKNQHYNILRTSLLLKLINYSQVTFVIDDNITQKKYNMHDDIIFFLDSVNKHLAKLKQQRVDLQEIVTLLTHYYDSKQRKKILFIDYFYNIINHDVRTLPYAAVSSYEQHMNVLYNNENTFDDKDFITNNYFHRQNIVIYNINKTISNFNENFRILLITDSKLSMQLEQIRQDILAIYSIRDTNTVLHYLNCYKKLKALEYKRNKNIDILVNLKDDIISIMHNLYNDKLQLQYQITKIMQRERLDIVTQYATFLHFIKLLQV